MADRRRYPVAMFDLPQDIARELPLHLIEDWVRSDQSPDAATELLSSNLVQGTTVVSDSAGLTRLSGDRDLIEILLLINGPKELIHSYGKAIGGEAVGIWAADNTQMWYGGAIDADDIVSMLLGVQDRIARDCEVSVGLGAHWGEFYSIGGGLYGPEADAIEEVAESRTEGGEIVVSERMAGRLRAQARFSLQTRTDISSQIGGFLRVLDGPRLPHDVAADPNYPIPFSRDLHAALHQYQRHPSPDLFAAIERDFLQQCAVVLVERGAGEGESTDYAVLDDLALSVLMRKTGAELLPAGGDQPGTEIKVAGRLGIYTFPECEQAVTFARRFREALRKAGVACRIGIDWGPLLVSDLPGGGKDVFGMPVNVASKIAQDAGRMNSIYLTCEVAQKYLPPDFTCLTLAASNLHFQAFEG